jgi:hypothetical protein
VGLPRGCAFFRKYRASAARLLVSSQLGGRCPPPSSTHAAHVRVFFGGRVPGLVACALAHPVSAKRVDVRPPPACLGTSCCDAVWRLQGGDGQSTPSSSSCRACRACSFSPMSSCSSGVDLSCLEVQTLVVLSLRGSERKRRHVERLCVTQLRYT